MNRLHSTLSSWREYLTPASHTSTFTTTGQLTPEEFVAAGDYLCYKFPTWSWCPADPSKRVSYLPEDKQYLVLKHAPCHTRLDDTFSTWNPGEEEEGEEGWTGGAPGTGAAAGSGSPGKVKTVRGEGEDAEEEDAEESEDEIPDMDEEEDDEAIIRDSSKGRGSGVRAPLRTYNLYITYSTYYRVPRSYLSGHDGTTHLPLSPPTVMFEDIAPDYREKTVTIEEFPCLENSVQMASVHPCRHAEVMKRMFEGLARRRMRKDGLAAGDDATADAEAGGAGNAGVAAPDEWEQISAVEDDGALRVDQYLVVFVKFMAGVVPGVEMDYTMGI